MFVLPSRLKTQGAVVAIATGIALGACSDPVAATDLRPEGDPEVLAVLVMNDADTLLYERATFCKPGDDKRPGLVGVSDFTTLQMCPADLTMGAAKIEDAVPTAWYVRIMFDELLDTNVEELIPILDPDTMQETGQFTGSLANTQPVILTCNGVVVPYDGYYAPGGNNVTWPIGPSLFIQPTDLSLVPTGADCSVEIKDSVTDKDGNPVPADQRGTGGVYSFKVASLNLVDSAPAAAAPGEEEEITADLKIVEAADCATALAALAAGAGGTARTAVVEADPDSQQAIDISIAGALPAGNLWNEMKAYAVTFADAASISDLGGGTLALTPDDLTLCFTTVAP
jgi:hypothetical protein